MLCRASLGLVCDTGLSALMVAATRQDAQVLQLLIRSGADVNLTSAEGKNALWFAITAAQEEAAAARQHDQASSAWWSRDIAAMLLSNGAHVNAADHAGMTSLMLAASITSDFHATPLIELLCQHGARAELQDNRGETALVKAAATGPFTSATLLLQAGGCINTQDNAGCTALMHSLKALPSHAEQRLTAQGFTVDSMASHLLNQEADVSLQDIAGQSALHLAVKAHRCNSKIICLLATIASRKQLSLDMPAPGKGLPPLRTQSKQISERILKSSGTFCN